MRLEDNRLDSERVAAIAEGLKGNSTLQSLNLKRNLIGDEGASSLAAILKETQITNLDFGANGLRYEAEQALKAAVKYKKAIKETAASISSAATGASSVSSYKPVPKLSMAALNAAVSAADGVPAGFVPTPRASPKPSSKASGKAKALPPPALPCEAQEYDDCGFSSHATTPMSMPGDEAWLPTPGAAPSKRKPSPVQDGNPGRRAASIRRSSGKGPGLG